MSRANSTKAVVNRCSCPVAGFREAFRKGQAGTQCIPSAQRDHEGAAGETRALDEELLSCSPWRAGHALSS